jgi:hypothetical protein
VDNHTRKFMVPRPKKYTRDLANYWKKSLAAMVCRHHLSHPFMRLILQWRQQIGDHRHRPFLISAVTATVPS